MSFSRFIGRTARNLFNPKSHLRRTVSNVANAVDKAIMGASRFAKKAGPAIAAAVPEAAPAIGAATGALSSYERIRDTVKNL